MAHEWNAVVLLDEADVFMAERNPQDVVRNELVSVFLRELEYFRGILFLTTNLYSSIDNAFRSRISLHMLFSPLGPGPREAVWRQFLGLPPSATAKDDHWVEVEGKAAAAAAAPAGGKSKGFKDPVIVDLTDRELRDLARWPLNGREIKNAAKMVRSWCGYKGYDLTLDRLEKGIRVTSPHAIKTAEPQGENDVDLYED
jgi:hypothetical protein